MFGRKKSESLNEQLAQDAHPARPGAKNRPTPKRREQEAARRRPLVETDRKAASARDKAARAEASAKQRQAMTTGDDRYLPPRDKGPERRFIRDYIDARWNIGEFLLPAMVLVLLLSFTGQQWAITTMYLGVYGLLAVSVLDMVFTWRRIKKKLVAKFGQSPSGGAWYAGMRSFQLRFARMPKPMVKRGQYPS